MFPPQNCKAILIDMKERILAYLTTECPWRDTLYWYETTDSTNTRAKQLAKEGAPHGTVLIAGHQTGGRGRMGRTFQSPEGQGVYLSVILRPNCEPSQLMHLTCAAGVAMMDAVETVSGTRPQVKWINDLVVSSKKLGGILTEMSVSNGLVEYAVIGIGINCLQNENDFPSEISAIATSVCLAAKKTVSPEALAAAMVEELWKLSNSVFTHKAQIMDRYRENCITLGKDIQVIRGDSILPGKAVDMDDDGGLLVRYENGSVQTVASGEVSVRGMYGYV